MRRGRSCYQCGKGNMRAEDGGRMFCDFCGREWKPTLAGIKAGLKAKESRDPRDYTYRRSTL